MDSLKVRLGTIEGRGKWTDSHGKVWNLFCSSEVSNNNNNMWQTRTCADCGELITKEHKGA
jgi:hypothetical protein